MKHVLERLLDSLPSSPMYHDDDHKTKAFTLLVAIYLGYSFFLGVYRLTLHPLSHIPGPKLAAFTYWYEIYYDVWLGGQYFRQIRKMHEKYGPVVRFNPNELHFNDPDFIDTLYPGASGRKTNRPLMVGKRSGTPDSMTGTFDHDLHRRRRGALNPFFSVASVRRLEPTIREHTKKVLNRMEQASITGEPVQMNLMFKAYASDTVVQYAFGDCFHFLDDPKWGQPYFEAVDKFFGLNHLFGHWPWIGYLVRSAPGWVMRNFGPSLREMWEKKLWWIQKVREIRASNDPERVKNTIFGGVLSSSLPDEEKTDFRLASETQLVVFAGEGTTAHTLSAAVFELLSNPVTLEKAKAELKAAITGPNDIISFTQLDGLSYFNAIIQETIRLHPGVVSRQWRESPEPIVYKDQRKGVEYVIPPNFGYSMTPLIIHHDPSVFENPREFQPQRWIDNPKLSRAFMGFSRGPRSCIGLNLARREIAVLLATLLLKYDLYRGQKGCTLELYDTVRERDINCTGEYIIPAPAKGSKGLRVLVRH